MRPMIGDSKPMARVFETIRNYAPLDASVLITGESGAGKGLAAWVLHKSGPRAGLPFIRFHCASLFYGEEGTPGPWPYDLSALGGGTLFWTNSETSPPLPSAGSWGFWKARKSKCRTPAASGSFHRRKTT